MSDDIYTPHLDTAYLLVTPFLMPSHDRGDRWAVAFSGNSSILLAAGLTAAVTLAFVHLWNLICFFALFLDGRKSRRRYAALVVIWNTRDPWATLVELVKYTLACKRSPTARGGGDLWFGVAFSLLAFCVFVATVVMGIIVPSLVHIADRRPKPGTGQFVLSVPNVQTFSLTGIVSLASILGFLALANLSIWLLVHFHQGRGKRSSPDRGTKWARFHVLEAAQLYRCVYESGGAKPSLGWSCEKPVPEGEDSSKICDLVHCCTKEWCKGHIVVDSTSVRPTSDMSGLRSGSVSPEYAKVGPQDQNVQGS